MLGDPVSFKLGCPMRVCYTSPVTAPWLVSDRRMTGGRGFCAPGAPLDGSSFASPMVKQDLSARYRARRFAKAGLCCDILRIVVRPCW
jgi:hypothetical protein